MAFAIRRLYEVLELLTCRPDGPERLAIIGPSLVEFGEATLLYCSATSVPPPAYTWSLDGVPTDVRGPVYVIASVTGSDCGKYTCTAVNTLTHLSQAADHVVSLDGRPEGSFMLRPQ